MSQTEQILGSISEDERNEIERRRALTSQILNQIGNLEWQKSRLTAQLEANEQAARQLLVSIRDRFEVSEETPWKIDNDGNFVTLSEETTSEG